MAKMVGYACNIKLQWLNQAVSMLEEGLEEKEYKERLNEYLSFEIDSSVRLRKTREILMHTWFYDSEETVQLRREALSLLKQYPEDASALHLCMIYLSYPVVADICKFMGRLFEYQDEITNVVLTQKLYDEWGERGALQTTCRRVTLTLKDMNLLTNETRTRYKLNKQTIAHAEVVNFILAVAMKLDGSSYHTFSEMNAFDLLFPFEYSLTKQQVIECDKFSTAMFGGEMAVSLSA